MFIYYFNLFLFVYMWDNLGQCLNKVIFPIKLIKLKKMKDKLIFLNEFYKEIL